MTLQAVFVILPSFACLALYAGIAVLLYRSKRRKNKNGVSRHTFITISLLLGLFYLSHWPSTLLRDLPRLFNANLPLPTKLTIAMSVFYYLNGITDPIVYGYRSKYLFTRCKRRSGARRSKTHQTGGETQQFSRSGSNKSRSPSTYCEKCRTRTTRNTVFNLRASSYAIGSSVAMTTLSSTA